MNHELYSDWWRRGISPLRVAVFITKSTLVSSDSGEFSNYLVHSVHLLQLYWPTCKFICSMPGWFCRENSYSQGANASSPPIRIQFMIH